MLDSGQSREVELQGISLSGGLAMGCAQRISVIDLDALVSFRHDAVDRAGEKTRFLNALSASREQITALCRNDSAEIVEIFAAQLVMLEDRSVTDSIVSRLAATGLNAECIIAERLVEIRNGFEMLDSEMLRARALDIQDVYHRILGNLLGIDHVRSNPLKQAQPGTVLVSQRLLPSDIVYLNTANIAAIVTETGSSISHAAILARSLEIPFVAGVRGAATVIRSGLTVLVDGSAGIVILHPREQTVQRLRRRCVGSYAASGTHPSTCHTLDGTVIRLLANASSPDTVETALAQGAGGIGLFRTEFYYLRTATQPSLEQEIDYYREVFRRTGEQRLCVRLFDFGGDKVPVFPMPGSISHSSFGNRGIRYLLDNPAVLTRQLGCLAAACGDTPFDLLVPFVSVEPELAAAVEQIQSALGCRGIERSRYRIGMMLEVPSAFFALERLLPQVDFLSVGTNDLIQYGFACDREDQTRSCLMAEAARVAVGIIRHVVAQANAVGKELAVCGELAGDVAVVPELLRAGVRSLSVSSAALGRVRAAVEQTRLH